MQIYLHSVWPFMAEPKSDHRSVHTGLKQFHGRAVPKYMWRDVFLFQRRATFSSSSKVLGKVVLNSIRSKGSAPRAEEQGLFWSRVMLTKPAT